MLHGHSIPNVGAGAVELAARRILEGMSSGRHRSPSLGSATEFRDHRAYAPGDDMRNMDWKAYARSDHLLVRRFHDERNIPLLICMDRSASMDYGQPNKWHIASVATAALCLLACRSGDRFRLAYGAAQLEQLEAEHSGERGFAQLCNRLQTLQPASLQTAGGVTDNAGSADNGNSGNSTENFAQVLQGLGAHLSRRSLLILVSDFLDDTEAVADALVIFSARGHDVVLLQVLDASEQALPREWGASMLVDPEGQYANHSIDAANMSDDYAEVFAAHQRRLSAHACALRAEHVVLSSDADVATVLGSWLHKRVAQ